MKIAVAALLVFISLTGNSISRSGWFWQNPLPQGNNLHSVKFIDQNTGFAVGDAGTFMKTTNAGLNWTSEFYIAGCSNDFTNTPLNISSFFILSNSSIFISTNNCCRSLIMRSVDFGSFWDTVFTLNRPIQTISFPNDTIGFAFCGISGGTYGEIYKTTNGGLNWYLVNASYAPFFSCSFINSSTGWAVGWWSMYPAGGNSYVYKTTNSGINWFVQLNNASAQMNTVTFINENTGWAGGLYNLYKTTNAGSNWVASNFSINSLKFINTSTGFCLNNNNVYKTTNTGENWFLNSSIGGNSIDIIDTNNIITVGNYGTMTKTTDAGINWQLLTGSVTNGDYLYSVYFVNNFTGYVIANSGDVNNEVCKILKTTNAGGNWINNNLSSANMYDIFFLNSNTGWVVGDGIRKTIDGGIKWVTQLNYLRVYSVYFIDQNTGWAVADNHNVFHTTDGGLLWTNISVSVYFSYNTFLHFFDSNTGITIGSSGISRTANGGINWMQVNSNSWSSGCVDNMNFLYSNQFNVFYKSTDLGLNWTLVSNTIPTAIYGIQMLNPQIGYGCGFGGFIGKTTNGGLNWYRQNSKFGNQLRSIYFANENSGWIVGDGGAILNTVDGGGNFVEITNLSSQMPVGISLHQNYPNPFNPVTKIKFDVPNGVPPLKGVRGMMTRLIIYDILGREVATLLNESLKPGSYEAEWDGSNFASGIYFYSLQTEDASSSLSTGFNETKKMVLMK